MNKNIKALTIACDQLNYSYEISHSSKNVVSVLIDQKKHLFTNWSVPITPTTTAQLCKDKDFFYSYFKGRIQQPKTLSFLNPNCNDKFNSYLKEQTIDQIIETIQQEFYFPLIIKKNNGNCGRNVFKINNKKKLKQSILNVFDKNSAFFDYICLAQEFINIKTEYRAIFLNSKLVFAYEKNISNAEFDGNLSPLHWNGAQAILLQNQTLLNRFRSFCQPLFDTLDMPFCGLDLAVDYDDEIWLLEANSAPGFDHIIKGAGFEVVVDLYKEMLSGIHCDMN